MKRKSRLEKDSLGTVKVPEDALWGAQTQRSIENFGSGKELVPLNLIYSITLIKRASAIVNYNFGLISKQKKELIIMSCEEILDGNHNEQFPLKVWQTGSGTQTNMNVNEVISNIACLKTNSELGSHHPLHPNDDVNKSQSTNDTFPAAIQISVVSDIQKKLIPSMEKIVKEFEKKMNKWDKVIKISRTHFQDAVPISLGQELSAWVKQIKDARNSIKSNLNDLYFLPLGGTAVGTGMNAPENFNKEVSRIIKNDTNLPFLEANNNFALMASHDRLANLMGSLKTLASALFKISNDIKILSSGPRSGIYELLIPANEPGSSIMPGKVNPTQCEALSMICAQVMGLESAVSIANASGTLQMNEYKPLIGFNLITSIRLLSEGINNFRIKLVEGMEPNHGKIESNLDNSLMLITALVPEIGYEKSAKIANFAFQESISLKEANLKLGFLSEDRFNKLINPENMV